MTKNNETKTLKKQSLRNNEYYGTQASIDRLYEQSQKGYNFKHLMSLITSEDNLMLAFRNIKANKGSYTPGVNKTTIETWAEKSPDQYLKYIRARLRNYQPMPVRRVEIPKQNGKTRPLGIPTIEDRLIQQSIKQILEPICEAKFFKHSYGFRPNRSTEHAVAYFVKKINLDSCRYVVDVDIKGFFDNVNHGKLLKQIWTMGIRDKKLISIISAMLKAPINQNGKLIDNTKGTPQGGILSPLLSNIVLNELDWWITSQWLTFNDTTKMFKTYLSLGIKNNSKAYSKMRKTNLKEVYIVRYADDFKILCKNKDDAYRIFYATKQWLKDRLKLDISPEKSGITDIRKHQSEFLGFKFKAFPKRNKYVIQSHMSEKAIEKSRQNLSKKIEIMGKQPSVSNVGKYNSAILGIQNYYKIATMVNIDLSKVAYSLSKKLKNRIRSVENKTGLVGDLYKSRFKNNYKKHFVAGIVLFPLADIQTKPPMAFQNLCQYTKEGRAKIHGKLAYINPQILKYLMITPADGTSLLFHDNRISLYAAQKGLSGITKEPLTIGNMEVHHIIPKSKGGKDNYQNLIFLTKQEHHLIHYAPPYGWTADEQKLFNKILQDEGQFRSLNKYRKKANNVELTREVVYSINLNLP